jgi:hypothetical protein
MTDNGLAALAAALENHVPIGLSEVRIAHDRGRCGVECAAAILGERGVFLPDGRITRKVLRTWQEGAARDEATIATLRAAIEKFLTYDHRAPNTTRAILHAALAAAKETP